MRDKLKYGQCKYRKIRRIQIMKRIELRWLLDINEELREKDVFLKIFLRWSNLSLFEY